MNDLSTKFEVTPVIFWDWMLYNLVWKEPTAFILCKYLQVTGARGGVVVKALRY
jgi:hypothetical protein